MDFLRIPNAGAGGMSQVGASMAKHMMHSPTGRLSQQLSEPQRFPTLLEKMGK